MYTELNIGERLRLARKAAKLTGEELGQIVGIGKSQISNIEKGISELKRSNAIVFSEALSVSLDWLVTGIGEMRNNTNKLENSSSFSKSLITFKASNSIQNSQPSSCQQALAVAKVKIELLEKALQDRDQQIEF
ncbi:helix-turn-helix domain-containing protein [Pontibacter sp. CAU 1760]